MGFDPASGALLDPQNPNGSWLTPGSIGGSFAIGQAAQYRGDEARLQQHLLELQNQQKQQAYDESNRQLAANEQFRGSITPDMSTQDLYMQALQGGVTPDVMKAVEPAQLANIRGQNQFNIANLRTDPQRMNAVTKSIDTMGKSGISVSEGRSRLQTQFGMDEPTSRGMLPGEDDDLVSQAAGTRMNLQEAQASLAMSRSKALETLTPARLAELEARTGLEQYRQQLVQAQTGLASARTAEVPIADKLRYIQIAYQVKRAAQAEQDKLATAFAFNPQMRQQIALQSAAAEKLGKDADDIISQAGSPISSPGFGPTGPVGNPDENNPTANADRDASGNLITSPGSATGLFTPGKAYRNKITGQTVIADQSGNLPAQ